MKVLAKDYTFTASTKTLTINNVGTLQLDQLLLVTNVTDGIIIYNFAKPELGATKTSTATFVLDYNTASMSNTDRLQIFIDIPEATEAAVLTTPSPSSIHAIPTTSKTLYSIYGTSLYGQEQYVQVRYGSPASPIENSWNLFSAKIGPFESFKFDFPNGLDISSQAAANWQIRIVNSSTPNVVNLNNDNLIVNAVTSKYTR